MQFFLGTHLPHWLARPDMLPLFVSHRRLKKYRTLPRARHVWALDSGGFTEVSQYGGWRTTPEEYAAAALRYQSEIGHMLWAAPQDWMCEPFVLKKTGKTVRQHQEMTVANFLLLKRLAPTVPWVPVLQGYEIGDYFDHLGMYLRHDVPILNIATVGLGSICRRQGTQEIADLVMLLHRRGMRLHGFGVKIDGLAQISRFLTSADSMAWSFAARHAPPLPGHTHKNCANCLEYALAWRQGVLKAVGIGQIRTVQTPLPFYEEASV